MDAGKIKEEIMFEARVKLLTISMLGDKASTGVQSRFSIRT
jgi:hypothetical protein